MNHAIPFTTEHEALLRQNSKSIQKLDSKFDNLESRFDRLEANLAVLTERQHRDGILHEEMKRGIELILETVDVRHEVQSKQNAMSQTLEKHDNRISAIELKLG